MRAPVRGAILATTLLLCLVAGAGYLGNAAASRADTDLRTGRFADAAVAADRAHQLQPWSTEPSIQLAEADLGLGDLVDARVAIRRALAADSGDWESWLDLALATSGKQRKAALARAEKLYPQSPEVAQVKADDTSAAASIEARSGRRHRVTGSTGATGASK
jgi:predicted Zn-dependent protease